MKSVLLMIFATASLWAQPVISGPNPQVRKGSGPLRAIGTVNIFTGSGAPGTVAGSQQGDFYLDTSGSNTYQCFGAGPCNAVAAGNWVQVSSAGGTFTDLTVSTLQVTSPLYNAATITGGIVVGGDMGITGGITGTNMTMSGNSNAMGALQLNSNSTSALHIPNGGITIDGGFATTSINAAGNIVVTGTATVQAPHVQVSGASSFGGNITVTGDINDTGSVNLSGGSFTASGGGVSVSGNIVTSAGQVRVGGAHVILDPAGAIQFANGAGQLDNAGNVNGVNAGFSGTVTAPNFFSNTGNFKVSGDNILLNRTAGGTVQQTQYLLNNNANAVGSYTVGSDNAASFAISYGNGSVLKEAISLQGSTGNMFIFPSSTSVLYEFSQGAGGHFIAGSASNNDAVILDPGLGVQIVRQSAASGRPLAFLVNLLSSNVGSFQVFPDSAGTLQFQWGSGSSTLTQANWDNLGNLTLNNGGLTVTNGGATFGANVTASAGTMTALKFRNLSMITSCAAQPAGTFWNNSGVVNVCP